VTGLKALIATDDFDFLDFGCSKGGSLQFGKSFFGGHRGLGVDIDPQKVETTRALGLDAVEGDVTQLNLPDNSVSFVLMLDFLEHLSGFDLARRAIASACRVAKDFVFIRHPWFDADGALMEHRLKFYWSDWHGHPNNFGQLSFYRALARSKNVHQWMLFGQDRVTDSHSPDLLPLDAPIDLPAIAAEVAQARPMVEFNFKAYRQITCLIQINPDYPIQTIVDRLPRSELLFTSGAGDRSLSRPES